MIKVNIYKNNKNLFKLHSFLSFPNQILSYKKVFNFYSHTLQSDFFYYLKYQLVVPLKDYKLNKFYLNLLSPTAATCGAKKWTSFPVGTKFNEL